MNGAEIGIKLFQRLERTEPRLAKLPPEYYTRIKDKMEKTFEPVKLKEDYERKTEFILGIEEMLHRQLNKSTGSNIERLALFSELALNNPIAVNESGNIEKRIELIANIASVCASSEKPFERLALLKRLNGSLQDVLQITDVFNCERKVVFNKIDKEKSKLGLKIRQLVNEENLDKLWKTIRSNVEDSLEAFGIVAALTKKPNELLELLTKKYPADIKQIKDYEELYNESIFGYDDYFAKTFLLEHGIFFNTGHIDEYLPRLATIDRTVSVGSIQGYEIREYDTSNTKGIALGTDFFIPNGASEFTVQHEIQHTFDNILDLRALSSNLHANAMIGYRIPLVNIDENDRNGLNYDTGAEYRAYLAAFAFNSNFEEQLLAVSDVSMIRRTLLSGSNVSPTPHNNAKERIARELFPSDSELTRELYEKMVMRTISSAFSTRKPRKVHKRVRERLQAEIRPKALELLDADYRHYTGLGYREIIDLFVRLKLNLEKKKDSTIIERQAG